MAYTTYMPVGALVALTIPGTPELPIAVFDRGRTALMPWSREAMPDYGQLLTQPSPLDLAGSVIVPLANEQLPYTISIGAGGTGNPYNPCSTAWVQDVIDNITNAIYTQQVCTAYAAALGKGIIVQNLNARILHFESTTSVVTFITGTLILNCAGIWTTPSARMFASQGGQVGVPHGTNILLTLTGVNTSWTSGTTASVSGGTGASIVNQSIVGQLITATINPGSAAGTLTFSNSTDSSTAVVVVS